MRAWPVARSIFDAPLGEKSERADKRLDNYGGLVISARQIGARTLIACSLGLGLGDGLGLWLSSGHLLLSGDGLGLGFRVMV